MERTAVNHGSGSRALGVSIVLAAGVSGLAWFPTFGLVPMLLPVLVPVAVTGGVDLALRTHGRWRAPAVLGAGIAAVVATFVLTGSTPGAVLDGSLLGWRRVMESTLPVRADAETAAFVPVLVVLAATVGVEWGRRGAGPGPALAPGLIVLLAAQLVSPAGGASAVALSLVYGAAAVLVLLASRSAAPVTVGPRAPRARPLLPMLAALAVIGAALAVLSTLVTIPGQQQWSLQATHEPVTRPLAADDPLSSVADDLLAANDPAFVAQTSVPVDRWPLVVLDSFDGTSWTSSNPVLRLGTGLPPRPPAIASTTATARISRVAVATPWLPSQERLRGVVGADPMVEPATGVLLRDGQAPDAYTLSWDDVQIDPTALDTATVDVDTRGGLSVDTLPAGFVDVAHEAVGRDATASLSTALRLERWMRETYELATDGDLPTGHSHAQLLTFLTVTKRGTSEQFATSYALLATALGIPTRVVVGYRGSDASGEVTVHRGDVLAWPEVAVAGVGWVPLDPTGGASGQATGRSALARATQNAREQLPPSGALPSAPVEGTDDAGVAGPALGWWPPAGLSAGLLLLLGALPIWWKWARRLRRRRPPGRASVIGAWLEVRDAIRDHGVTVAAGTTPRDLVRLTTGRLPVDAGDLNELAHYVDVALWSGFETPAELPQRAWAVSTRIRRGLRRSPLRRRIAATWSTRTLRRMRDPAPRRG